MPEICGKRRLMSIFFNRKLYNTIFQSLECRADQNLAVTDVAARAWTAGLGASWKVGGTGSLPVKRWGKEMGMKGVLCNLV